ncbi:MAG: hypothetical protein KC656_13785 [Myxococcales bacterium]|nr:hypothetical protein [Myxococcales bacterium]
MLVLACGGLGASHSELAQATAKMLADENDGVECALSTVEGSAEMMGWRYTFGAAEARPFPDDMRDVKDVFGKKIGIRETMLVVPVEIENTLPKKRAHDRYMFLFGTDGENHQSVATPAWLDEAIGAPNIRALKDSFKPNEKRKAHATFFVQSAAAAPTSVIRMYWTERKPKPDNPRQTYDAVQEQICVEVHRITEKPGYTKP